MSNEKKLNQVVKELCLIVPLLTIFLIVGIGNIYKLSTNKIKYVVTSKYCLGMNIDYIENYGCNYFCYELKKPGNATIGNTTKYYCSWYMNK